MLEIKNFSIGFLRYDKSFFKKEILKIITNFNLSVGKGEIVAIIGSSGAGKSLLANAVLGILPDNALVSGEMIFKGEILSEKRKKKIRGKEISLIPQSINYLNPLVTVGKQIYRTSYNFIKDKNQAKNLRDVSFLRYNLKENVKKQHPFQISGGMARRVMTAIATVNNADLINADEPTTGLDPATIDESLTYLKKLSSEGKSILFITHDIKYALKYADKIAVFYGGTTVEVALPSDFKKKGKLRHPYSKALYESLPENDFTFIPGFNPFGDAVGKGCVFAPRCTISNESCKEKFPEQKTIEKGKVWCHNA
jgi:peptide/nickel transport system ATP-binding protein